MFGLKPPRHISTLPFSAIRGGSARVSIGFRSGIPVWTAMRRANPWDGGLPSTQRDDTSATARECRLCRM